ncbi:MAG: flagellar motor protein MotB [Hyphomicrobiales bacterium]
MAEKCKCPEPVAGAPAWMVTFADLMSLLVCFFVLIVSFSIQDKEKLQVVAGSLQEAFGVVEEQRKNGVIEVEGKPTRDWLKQIALIDNEQDADFDPIRQDDSRKQGPEANTHTFERAEISRPKQFATAAASLRQAWQELPEIAELSKSIIIEETPEGLNISFVDQDGRSMFPEGSKRPYETTRKLLEAAAPILRQMPNRLSITGHTTAGAITANPNYTGWELSADRANGIRAILTGAGLGSDRIFAVVGKGSTEPLFPNDPFLASNRRIEILLMHEAPPTPAGHKL